MTHPSNTDLILVTGATGYVGGRLARALLDQGRPVRCMARRPEVLQERFPDADIAYGDVSEPDSLAPALDGVHTAYYLIHSMGDEGSFEEQERRAAENFAQAARDQGVQRIIYLGGLASEGAEGSPHMRSRLRVGKIFRESGVPAIEFRASIIIGSGSLSYELIRALVRRLPVMITPRWVHVEAQPIFIGDVLAYLIAAMDLDAKDSRIYEIGGADRATYSELMRIFAKQRGLRRIIIPVPVLTPKLSSLWLHFVTPIYASVGRKLIESIIHPSVVQDHAAKRDFDFEPMGVEDAFRQAQRMEDTAFVETHWSDSLSSTGPQSSYGGLSFGGRFVDARYVRIEASAEEAFAPIRRIGGTTGWYYGNGLWKLRGFLDRIVGGVGMRRGRRDPESLRVGDAVDWWRVDAYEPNRRLVLHAEMKLPGRAWLHFEVRPDGGTVSIWQVAVYDPIGILGNAYWYILYPFHLFIFDGMLRRIAASVTGQHPRELDVVNPGDVSDDAVKKRVDLLGKEA